MIKNKNHKDRLFLSKALFSFHKSIFFYFFAILILGGSLNTFGFASPAQAAGLTCTSAQAGNWSNADTWGSCGGGVPGAADNVVIVHAVILTENVDITSGIITVNTGGTLDTSVANYAINAAKLTINTGGTVIANGSIITLSGTGTVFTPTGTFTAGTSTFKYTGGTTATNIASTTYYNLYLDHDNTTYTAAGNIAVTNVFTVNAGTFSGSNRTITLSGTTGTPFVLTGAFTSGTSTVSYTGNYSDGNTNVVPATYYKLTVNNASETFDAAGDITVASIFTITAGIFDAKATILTLSGTGTPFVKTGTFNCSTSTIKYTGGTTATNITSTTYYNLYLDHAGTTYTAANAITINNVFTINAGIFNASSRTITLSGNTGTPFVNNDTFTASTSTISYTGDNPGGNTSIIATTYYNLTFNNASETYILSGDLIMSGSWTNTAGTVDTDGHTITFNGATTIYNNYTLYKNITSGGSTFDNVIFDNAAGGWQSLDSMTINGNLTMTAGLLRGNQNVTVKGGNVTGDGTINLVYGTFLLDGTGDFGGTTNWTFNNLTFGDGVGAATTTKISTNQITLTGVLTIAANQTLDAGDDAWILTGPGTPFIEDGTFTANASTIRYAPYETTTVTAADYYNLEITRSVVAMTDIWVANGGTNNIMKLDSAGTRIGTYYTPYRPRGMAVDASNNLWVAGRFDNVVTKYSSDGIPIFTTTVGAANDSLFGLAIDPFGNVWAENQISSTITKINGSTGEIMDTFSISSGSWGGIAADSYGNIWVANDQEGTVTKLSNAGSTIGVYFVGTTPISIAIDRDYNVWVANYDSDNVTKLNGSTGETIGTYNVGTKPHSVTIDADGNVWTANVVSNNVTKLNGLTGETIGTYLVGLYPVNAVADADGNIWVPNASSNNIKKLNGSTGDVIGTYAVSSWPYSLNDMTGFVLQYFTCGGSCGAGKDVTLSAGTFNIDNNFTIGDGSNLITVTADTNDPLINVLGNFNVLANATFIPTATPDPGQDSENNDNEKDLDVHSINSSSTENSITLTWKTDHNTKSIIRYGTDRKLKEKKKDNKKEKKHKVVLKDLLPNTKYYFKIKATYRDGNEDSSSIHLIMTKSVLALSSNLNPSSNENSNQLPTPTESVTNPLYSRNSSPNICSYVIESGDTLWSIAKKVYGDATVYPLIIDKNKDKYADIESKLSIGQELSFCDNNQNSQTTGSNSNIDSSSEQNQSQPQTETFHWWNPFSWF